MHTDSGDLTSTELGFYAILGHVDFFPNGGIEQPGCSALPEEKQQRGAATSKPSRYIISNHFWHQF